MVFSSLEFLLLFLPVTMLVYYLVPPCARNAVLLLVSLVFYGWGEPVYIFLMLATILADYLFGLLLERRRAKGKSPKIWLVSACVFNLGLLFFFKYTDFVLENLARLPFLSGVRPLGISLPIGISFYIFQALSYVIDVYRGDARVQKKPISFGSYVTQYPQLIAGPIVRYQDVDDQLRRRDYTLEKFSSGIRCFLCGLGKKVLLANVAGAGWEYLRAIPDADRGALLSWLGLLLFSFQIYFDFSGYSDMAVGLGRMLGFEFPINFNYPYISESITEFWRRWHITLGTWFREYVYIPLGGNRVSRPRWVFNLFAVWLLTGLWHGASWNYLCWGLYFFVILAVEKLFLLRRMESWRPFFRHFYAVLLILFGWLIFAFEDMGAGLRYAGAMFSPAAPGGADVVYEAARFAFLLVLLTMASLPVWKRTADTLCQKHAAFRFALDAGGIGVAVLSVAYLVSNSYNPFLYFNF